MPQANTVKDQIAKFHRLCDLCELDKDNTPQINYREALFNHYFQYAEDQVLVTLVDFAKGQAPQLKLFEEILQNVDENAYGYYKAHAHPLIILKANDFSQLQVFPNVTFDAGTDSLTIIENLSIIDVKTVFTGFITDYEKDKTSKYFEVCWGDQGNVLNKFSKFHDQSTATVLTALFKDYYKPDRIRDLAQKIETARKPLELIFAETPEEFTTMYATGPASCMSQTGASYKAWETLTKVGLCPPSFYSYFPYTKGAYIMVHGKVAARAILWQDLKNKDKWRCGRIFATTGEMHRKFVQALHEKGITVLENNLTPPEGTTIVVPGIKDASKGGYIMPFPYFDNLDYYGKGFNGSFNVETKEFTLVYHKTAREGVVPINGRGGYLLSTDYIERKCEHCGSKTVSRHSIGWVSTDDGHLYCGSACAGTNGYVTVVQGTGNTAWMKDDPLFPRREDGLRFSTLKAAYDLGYYLKMSEIGVIPEEHGDVVTSGCIVEGEDHTPYTAPQGTILFIRNLVPIAEIKTQKTVIFDPQTDLVAA